MKIKKVEIQAFRSYDKAENSTFDFEISNGNYADFISLYAPNGFGKTSFYDAVEYSYTNNIDRLLKNKNKDVAKSEKNINKSEKQYILRNRLSDPNLESYIKLTTTTDDFNKKIPIPRKNSSDYKFDDNETERKYFREVILSQDWISSFLREDKPDERFDKFIKYFGDEDLDNYRRILLDLMIKSDKQLKSLQNDLSGVQPKLKYDADLEILSKINEKINLLNQLDNQFKVVDTYTGNKDILELSNVISEKKNELSYKVIKIREIFTELEIIIAGTEQVEGFRGFKKNIQEQKRLSERLSSLRIIKTKFINFNQKKEQIESIQNRNKQLEIEKNKKESTSKTFPDYIKVTNRIKEKDKEISELKIAKGKLFKEISDTEATSKENIVKAENLQNQITEVENNLEQLPNTIKIIIDSQNNISEIKKAIELNNDKLEKESNEYNLVSLRIEELKKVLIEISNKNYPSQFESIFEKYKVYIQKISNSEKSLDKKNKELQSLNIQIKGQKSFQKDLELFVSKGLSIINEQKTSSCPLCSQNYRTYNDLADAVSNNKLLSEKMSELLNEKNEIENSYQKLSEDLQKSIQELTRAINKDIAKDELITIEIQKIIFEINKTINRLKDELLEETKKMSSQTLLLQNKSKLEYENWAKETLNFYKIESEKLKSTTQSIHIKLSKEREEFQIINQKLESALSAYTTLENSEILENIRNFFVENYPNQKISSEFLSTDLKSVSDKIQTNINSVVELLETVKMLENELLDSNEDKITNEITLISDKFNRVSANIDIYKLNSSKYITSGIDEMDENTFNKVISELKLENEKKISYYSEEIKELDLLSELKDNVLPYLEFEENKKVEFDIKSNIDKKKKTNVLLKGELKKVNSHIEKQIKSFFYEDLINELYKRIDPHPEYTKVKFIPDFKDSKPKLNVCVYGKNDDDFIIPNLYFSQAQLNILSLCIFLAKALNVRDDDENPIDCIFVDDPIQSMDSINILSTIDLFRSIVVNHGKQIILSTHDENFHNLLKKKIPPTLFKSKFMELETFGKVKLN